MEDGGEGEAKRGGTSGVEEVWYLNRTTILVELKKTYCRATNTAQQSKNVAVFIKIYMAQVNGVMYLYKHKYTNSV